MLNNKFYLLFIAFFWVLISNNLYPKILVITSAYNRSDFIETQYKTFNKFLKDDYEFVVFSDAKEDRMRHEISKKCKELGIICINVPQEIHDRPYLERVPGERFNKQGPAVRNCNVVQYTLDTIGFKHDDIVVIMDSDLFLVREFSIREYLENHHISSWLRLCCDTDKKCKKNHPGKPGFYFMWIGLVFLDMRTMPNKELINFNCGLIDKRDVDAGGYTYYYLKNNPAKGKFFDRQDLRDLICDDCRNFPKPLPPCTHNESWLIKSGFDKNQISLIQSMSLPKRGRNIQFFLNNNFIHYQAGSNYTGFSFLYHQEKTKLLNKYFRDILQY